MPDCYAIAMPIDWGSTEFNLQIHKKLLVSKVAEKCDPRCLPAKALNADFFVQFRVIFHTSSAENQHMQYYKGVGDDRDW